MSVLNIRVMPAHLGWSVLAEDQAQGCKLFGSLNEAIEAGTEMAKLEKAELVVYGLDGSLRMHRSFSEAPTEATSFKR